MTAASPWEVTLRSEPVCLERRQALALLGGAALSALPLAGSMAREPAQGPLFLACALLADGSHGLATLSGSGRLVATLPLPARGHDCAVRGDGLCVVFARRPGSFALAFYPGQKERAEPQVFAAPTGRHFNGHGAFSHDGRVLFASENDFAAARGVIGLYDASTFERLGEIPSGGIGPHEILTLPNGHLAVANGGIETHPDFPRAKLNLETMRANITILDPQRGTLLEQAGLADHLQKLSIRHMAWSAATGALWFGCQWQGAAGAQTSLVGRYAPGGELSFVPEPRGGWHVMRDYIGSVAASADGQSIAVTSPRGGRVMVFDASGTLRESRAFADVCGAAFAGKKPLLSDGEGRVHHGKASVAAAPPIRAFDNHLRRVG